MALPSGTGPEEDQRRAALRRMKAVAAGFLLGAAGLYAVALAWQRGGDAPAAAGYLRAAAEAGMVGGLADWFAVTALFRHPLRLPVPHTAIIPRRKDQLGAALGDFVGRHFLAADVVRARLASAEVARRLGAWLAVPRNAERVTAEAATVVRAGIALLNDEDVQEVAEAALTRRIDELHLGPPLGRVLGQVVADDAHTPLVDLVATNVHRWLAANEAAVVEVVARQAPDWSVRFLDEMVARRVHAELVRISDEVTRDPQHPVRRAVDRYLVRLADDLRRDRDTNARLDAFVASLAGQPEVRAALGTVLGALRRVVVEAVEDPASELRRRSRDALAAYGARAAAGGRTTATLDAWVERVAVHVVTAYREEITRLITDTVGRWDAEETSRRVELQVGRDLQFIRINGTLVGALVGIAIHAVAQAVS